MTDNEKNAFEAKFDLLCLNLAVGNRIDVHCEVAKAVALADKYAGIEARVVCYTKADVTRALEIIYSPKVWARENAKWNSTDGGMEFPNGSIVVVMFEGKKAVPK